MGLLDWLKDREDDVRDVFDANTKRDQQKRLAAGQPRYYQQQKSPVEIRPKVSRDNQPGFQITNNSLTRGLSRGFDQLNPLDNGRTWQQRVPTTNLSTGQQFGNNAIVRDFKQRGNILGKGLTTAVGGNRNLQNQLNRSVDLDQNAFENYTRQYRQGKINPTRYNALLKSIGRDNPENMAQNADIVKYANPAKLGAAVAETALDVGTLGVGGLGFQAGKQVLKQVGTQGAKGLVNQASRQAGRELAKDIGTGAALGAGSGALGSIRSYQPTTLRNVARDTVLGAALGGAMPVGGAALSGGEAIVRGLPAPFRGTTDELLAIKRVEAQRSGWGNVVQPNDVAVAQNALARHGVDINDVKAVDNLLGDQRTFETRQQQHGQRVGEVTQTIQSVRQKTREAIRNRTPLNEGGYARIPFGSNDPAPDLHPKQKEFINDYAEMLESMDDGLEGGYLKPNGEGGYTRGSDHTSTYKNLFGENGRTPTKQQWFDEARRQLEEGDTVDGSHEFYKELTNEVKDRVESVASHAKQKAREVYEATGDVNQAKAAHNAVIDKARELNSRKRMGQKEHPMGQQATPEIGRQQTIPQDRQQLGAPAAMNDGLPPFEANAKRELQDLSEKPGSGEQQTPQIIVDSSASKIQQKAPVVNEAQRAIKGAEKDSYGLRDSFDNAENVPDDLKDALGAFGNERTVKSNKELWQTAQQRVGTDAATAMKYFADNSNDEAVATGYALINRFMKNGQTKEAGEIAMTMAERALESGRTTQAYALMKQLTPEGSVQYVENKVARYVKQHPRDAKKLNWNDSVRKQLYDMAEQVNKMPEGQQRNLLIGRMQELVDNIFPSSLSDKAITVWKAGLLTSLRTHERNIIGNTINLVGEQAATVPGSIVDRLMSLRTGKRTLVTSTGEGLGKGAKTGAVYAKDQIKTGIDVTNSNLKYNINHITWSDNKVEQTLKKFTDAVFRPLGAEDKLFKESVRENSLHNQAIAEARNKGLRGKEADEFVQTLTQNPTAKMRDIADDDAGRATFSHDNFLGDIIRDAKGAVRRSNKRGAKTASAFLDVLMPFTQIPSGVASQLYAYSPAKLMKSTYDIGKVLITGDPEFQRQAAQGFGRSVVGTSMIGAGLYLATTGKMVGQPRDDAERAQWEAQGIKPNSVKVGDRWYQLSSIGPQTLLVLAGAQIEQDKKAGEAVWTNLAANIGRNFKDQTFLKGMSSALDAIGDPARYADAYLQQQVTSVVPNILKDVARATDPKERQANGLVDRTKSGIPGLSRTLPERVDSYGQTSDNTGAIELIDLFNSSKARNLPEVDFTEGLRNTTGETKHIPSKVPRSVTINGEKLKLDSQQASEYQRYLGEESKKFLGQIKEDPKFLQLDKAEQVKKIDSALQDINTAAKIKLFGNTPKTKNANVRNLLAGGSVKTPTLKPESYKEKYESALAEFNDTNNGWSEVERAKKTKELRKLKVQKDYDNDIVSLYGMSKSDMFDFISHAKNGKALSEKLIAYDNALYDAGLTQYKKYRTGLAPSKGKKGKGGSKKGSKAKNNRPDRSSEIQVASALAKLIAGAGSGLKASAPKQPKKRTAPTSKGKLMLAKASSRKTS